MKLSNKQIELIRLLKEGRILSHTRFIGYSAVYFSHPTLFVNKNTKNSLLKKEIIKIGVNKGHGHFTYVLTDLGKTIDLC